MIMMIFGVLALCILMSTPETRAAGREWAKPIGRIIGTAAVILIVLWVGVDWLAG